MTTKEFQESVNSTAKMLADGNKLDREVQIQMHTSDGTYIGNAYEVKYVGYKFSPWKENSGSLVIELQMIDKDKVVAVEKLDKLMEEIKQLKEQLQHDDIGRNQ